VIDLDILFYYIIYIYYKMTFVLIIFADIERTSVLKIVRFRTMKQIIKMTGNKVNYYDVRRDNTKIKYRTNKSLFQVVKV